MKKRRIKNTNLYPTASITKSEFWGMPLGEDLWGDNFFSVTSKSTENYSIVKNGWISFNPSRANVGSFGININNEPVAVTSAYPVYECIDKNYSPEYIYLMLTRNKEVMEEIVNRSYGTVRQALSNDDFLSIQIPDIPLNDQLQIVTEAKAKFATYKNAKQQLDSYQL